MSGSVMGIYATVLLKRKIDEVIARPRYHYNHRNWENKKVTWCNEAANAILVELGYDTLPILEPRGRIGWTGATMMYDLAVEAVESGNSDILEMEPFQAQAAANIGNAVLAAARRKIDDRKHSSHVGIVYPTDDPWNEKKGPLIGQAGSKYTHGIRSAYDSFVKWGLSTPRYFQLPRKQEA